MTTQRFTAINSFIPFIILPGYNTKMKGCATWVSVCVCGFIQVKNCLLETVGRVEFHILYLVNKLQITATLGPVPPLKKPWPPFGYPKEKSTSPPLCTTTAPRLGSKQFQGSYLPTKFSRTELFPALWPPTTAIWGRWRLQTCPTLLRVSCRRLTSGIRSSIPWLPIATEQPLYLPLYPTFPFLFTPFIPFYFSSSQDLPSL